MTTATDKQIDYIVSLYNQLHGTDHSWLSQCDHLPMSQRERTGGMTKSEASTHIDSLKSQLD